MDIYEPALDSSERAFLRGSGTTHVTGELERHADQQKYAGAEHEGARPGELPWRCLACTFDNHPAMGTCEMCDAVRPARQPGRAAWGSGNCAGESPDVITTALQWTIRNASAELASSAHRILHDRSVKERIQKALISLPTVDPPGHRVQSRRWKATALSSLPIGYPPGYPDFAPPCLDTKEARSRSDHINGSSVVAIEPEQPLLADNGSTQKTGNAKPMSPGIPHSNVDDDSARSRADTIEAWTNTVTTGPDQPLLMKQDCKIDKTAAAKAGSMLVGSASSDSDDASSLPGANSIEAFTHMTMGSNHLLFADRGGENVPGLADLTPLQCCVSTKAPGLAQKQRNAVSQLIDHFEDIGMLGSAFNRRLMHALMVAGLRTSIE